MASKKELGRREFLRYAGIGGAGVLLAACAAPTPETIIEKVVETVVVKETVMVEGKERVVEKVITKEVERVVTKEVEKVVEKEVEKVVTATPSAAPKKITWLEMWSDAWGDAFAKQADKWEQDFIALHPEENIVIERRIFAGDANWEDVVMNAANAGTLEDLSLVNPYMIPPLVDKVPLAPIDDAREAVGGPEAFTMGFPWKGHEYVSLLYGSPLVPWVNMTMLEEAGAEWPKDWDGHLTNGKLVTDTAKQQYWNSLMMCGTSGVHLGWAFFFPWLLQAGGYGIDENHILNINDEAGVAVLEFWKEEEDAGILTPGSITNCGNFGLQMFGSGNTAYIGHEGPWMIPHFKSQKVAFDVQGQLVSSGPGGNTASAFGTGLVVSANAEHLDLAKTFLMYLTTGEANYECCISQQMISPYKPMIERVKDEIPMAKPLIEQGEIGARGMPLIAGFYDYVSLLSLHAGEFWIGDITAMEALDKTVEDWKAAVERV